MLALEFANGVHGLDRVATGFFLSGGNREGQGVDHDVLDAHSPVGGEVLDQPIGNTDLPFGRARLTLLIDGQSNDRCSVLAHEGHDARESGVRAITVFVVHRVDGCAATECLKTRFENRGLSRIDHDRQGGSSG